MKKNSKILKKNLLFYIIILFFILLALTFLSQKNQKNLIFTKAQNPPLCNPNNLTMTVNPNPAPINSLIEFSLSGTEGDTWIEDNWYPSGGVNCQGAFWGRKTCQALRTGFYIWEHKWKKCIGSIDNCSDYCAKTVTFSIVDQIVPSPTPTQTPTPTPTHTPTPTQTPTPTPTPTPSFVNMRVNLRLKFQGIRRRPSDNLNNLLVKITFKNEKKSINETVEKNFRTNDQLIWFSDPIEVNLPPDNNYALLIKGPKHLQKKICHNNPQEESGGKYLCRNFQIQLDQGDNFLDFSPITLFAGDLPNQDNILNSYDLSLVRNNLGKNDQETLSKADINLDGVVDSQDFSLLLSAMSIKLDEF